MLIARYANGRAAPRHARYSVRYVIHEVASLFSNEYRAGRKNSRHSRTGDPLTKSRAEGRN